MADLLLGIDIGTTGVRAAVFDASGMKLSEAGEAHRVDAPRAGWAESDAETWWGAVCRATRKIGTRAGDVACVGVVGQAPTAVLVDARGRALRPAVLWLDNRAVDEVAEIARALGCAPEVGAGGNRIHPYFLGPKLLWLKKHDAAALEGATCVLQSHSFVVQKLTDAATIDPSTAALCAPLFDLASRRWSEQACEKLGIPATLLAPVKRAEEIVGQVTRAAAEATGLREGTPVVCGGGDFAASTLASGVVEEGEACLMLGTAGNLLMPTRAAELDPRLINSHHVGCDRYLALGGTLCGGAQEWFRRACAGGASHETLDAEAERVERGSKGLLFLPYLQGERTPLWDVGARGVYFGLGLEHDRGAMWRALLEGIALSFFHCREVLRARGVTLSSVVATNGAGKSRLFREILCDALGVPLAYAPSGGGTVAGAALLAGLGAKLVSSPRDARAWLGETIAHEPDAAARATYDALFSRRLALYDAVKALFA